MSGKAISLSRPEYPEALRRTIAADIEAILASGRLMFGPWALQFEERFATLTRRRHAISLNTCTTALQIALMFAEVKGRDVLVPAGSFITDVSAVLFAGGRPILVDMSQATLGPDLDDLERKVTPNTCALIWVHLTGLIAADHAAILEFARRHNLYVIEDAAHAHGSKVDGRPAGSFGDASCFSFYPTKILSSGTGGVLLTDNDALAKFAREMRVFGKEAATGDIVHLGNDWFLDEIRACVACHHTGELSTQVAHRQAIAGRYQESLANQPGLRLLDVPVGSAPAWYQFPVFLDDKLDRDALIKIMKKNHNIEVKGIYKPTHHEKVFKYLDDGTLKSAERILGRSLCLPMHAGLSDDDVDHVATATAREIRAQLG
jgi:perosamine synthetase